MKKDINSSDWLISKGYYDMILNSSPENAIYTHEALTEYSDLKCQPLLERISELMAENELKHQVTIAYQQKIHAVNSKFMELQEAADKLAEALSTLTPDNVSEWELKKQALINYERLKGK